MTDEPQPTPRKGKPSPEAVDTYITVLAKTGRHSHACKAAEINPNSMRCWTNPAHPRFDSSLAAAREQAMVEFKENIMQELMDRAVHGTDVQLHYRGVPTGETVKQKSDRLFLALAQAYLPEMRPRQEVVSTNVHVDASALDPDNLSPEQLAALEIFMSALEGKKADAPIDITPEGDRSDEQEEI